MELSRLLRIARARWWLFAILAGVGLVGGAVLISLNNSRIKPQFETIAPVLFSFENDDDRQTGLQNLVEEALQQAQDANVENSSPLAIIRVDPEDRGIIQFVGLARNEANAQETALMLRDTYVEYARAQLQGTETETAQQKAQLEADVKALADEINQLNLQLQADPVLVAQRDELEDERGLLDNELDARKLEKLLGPEQSPNASEPRTIEDVDAEIAIIQTRIDEIDRVLETLQVPSSDILSETSIRLEIASDKYDSALQRLIDLEQRPEIEEPFSTGITENIDNTPEQASPILGGLLGLIVGAAVALAVVIVTDRSRQTVWVGKDLGTMPVLAEMAARNPLRVAGQLWYELGGPP
ncbi:MAG: hypothetical protein OEM97_02975, partial [Acidimicrobiia bacterium]|nr:hypothetical protein [Acidimicrobiia bacterium]